MKPNTAQETYINKICHSTCNDCYLSVMPMILVVTVIVMTYDVIQE